MRGEEAHLPMAIYSRDCGLNLKPAYPNMSMVVWSMDAIPSHVGANIQTLSANTRIDTKDSPMRIPRPLSDHSSWRGAKRERRVAPQRREASTVPCFAQALLGAVIFLLSRLKSPTTWIDSCNMAAATMGGGIALLQCGGSFPRMQ